MLRVGVAEGDGRGRQQRKRGRVAGAQRLGGAEAVDKERVTAGRVRLETVEDLKAWGVLEVVAVCVRWERHC